MKRTILILTFLILGISGVYAQNDFYFKKWKAKGEILAENVVLIMDSTSSIEGKEFNDKLGRLIFKRLNDKGISTTYTFREDSSKDGTLKIKFKMVKPAYVKLNTFEAKIPLCNRFEISQINKIPDKKNRQIKTTLSISVDKEENGIKQASVSFADLICESIKK